MEQVKRAGRPKTTEDTPLTDKQLLFCEYYLETLNQSESYRRVAPHVADTTARVEASKLMKKPNIRKYINERLESMKEAILPYLKTNERVNVFYGGAGSGKSYFAVQKMLIKALESPR